jgi:hypothetical protein
LDNTPSNLRLLGACRTGDPLSYILSTAMLVESVNLAVESHQQERTQRAHRPQRVPDTRAHSPRADRVERY